MRLHWLPQPSGFVAKGHMKSKSPLAFTLAVDELRRASGSEKVPETIDMVPSAEAGDIPIVVWLEVE